MLTKKFRRKKSNLLLRISRVSKSQPRTPNQLGDIASDILAVFFFKKTTKVENGMSQPFKVLPHSPSDKVRGPNPEIAQTVHITS